MTTSSPLSAGTHELNVNDVPLRYTVSGTGPVCLMHPGGPGVSPHYLRMPAVEEHVTAVYIDPLGTGGSGRLPTHPRGYTTDLYVSCGTALIDHLGQEKVYFLGHSHGGFLAQTLALRCPDRLAGLVLYATAPTDGPDFVAAAMRCVDEFARRFATHPGLPAVLAVFPDEVGPDTSDEESTRALQAIIPLYFADYWEREQELGEAAKSLTVTNVTGPENDFDYRPGLHEIGVPTLILAGRQDFICSPPWAHLMHREIKGSELVEFHRSGHLPHIEEPAAFAAAIGAFVSSAGR